MDLLCNHPGKASEQKTNIWRSNNTDLHAWSSCEHSQSPLRPKSQFLWSQFFLPGLFVILKSVWCNKCVKQDSCKEIHLEKSWYTFSRADYRFRVMLPSCFSLTAGRERGRKGRRKRHSGFIWLLSTGFSCHPRCPAHSEHTAKHHVHTARRKNNLLACLLPPVWQFSRCQRRKRRVCLNENTQTETLSHKQTHQRWLYVSLHLFIHCKTHCLLDQMWKKTSIP